MGIDRLGIEELRQMVGPFQGSRNFFALYDRLHRLMNSEPYRTETYGLSLITGGSTTFVADLVEYKVFDPSIVAMGPDIIRQWKYSTKETRNTALFFTQDFFLKDLNDIDYLRQFPFFHKSGRHSFPIRASQAEGLKLLFSVIEKRQRQQMPHSFDIIRGYITALLHEVSEVYETIEQDTTTKATNGQRILKNFKNLLAQHFKTECSVQFYADHLFINPKYLSQVVSEESGKSPSEWVNEMVMLEAKVLLRNPEIYVSAVADDLHFADASHFGKFFKRHQGQSPKVFREAIRPSYQ